SHRLKVPIESIELHVSDRLSNRYCGPSITLSIIFMDHAADGGFSRPILVEDFYVRSKAFLNPPGQARFKCLSADDQPLDPAQVMVVIHQQSKMTGRQLQYPDLIVCNNIEKRYLAGNIRVCDDLAAGNERSKD